jgi:L-ascorbate metabolism protein UlaG (beta-lactamase superfamily)
MKATKEDIVYLKPNVAPEPLIDQWYAWSHIISPVTAALNVKERHLKIMRSFIDHPEIHEEAVKNPSMKGGPFIDYTKERRDEIIELYDKTLKKRLAMLELAEAVVQLNQMLEREAIGYSMEGLYSKVPDMLRGYVELIYDLNNKPTFRLIEPLLYKSEFNDSTSQSIAFQLIDSDDSRSFILSTPRLEEVNIMHLQIPFDHEGIDELYKMRRIPNSYNRIKNILQIPEDKEEMFYSFFTTDPPKKYEKYTGEGIRVRYFGHACILVETKETSLLIDPVISYGYDSSLSRFTYIDLPDEIDAVLITHNHQDHILIETLLQIRHKVKQIIVPRSSMGNLVDPSIKLMLNSIGFDRVTEIGEFESVITNENTITGLPFIGEHSDLDVRSKLCYHVKLNNDFSLMFAADSCNKEPRIYEHVHKYVGFIDVIFLGMECDGAPLSWLYGPLMPTKLEREKDLTRRLAGSNCDQGMNLINLFNPLEVFVYAMGMEPWLEFISSIKYTEKSRPIVESNRLIQKCKDLGINAERLYGEKTIEYDREKIVI